MKFVMFTASAALAAALAAPAAQAQALPIVGGVTSVTLTAAPTLTSLGVGFATLGTAAVSPGSDGIPLAYFPVTGGAIDTATFAGSIEHDGSGLALSSAGTTVNLTDFIIDTVALTLTGQVAVEGGAALGAVPLFNLGLSGNVVSPFTLSLTSDAAGALSAVFGLPDLTGVTLGTASTIPITSAVPEPATYAAMLAGLALVALTLARRRGGAQEQGGW
jgi:hypothetical protein